MNFLTRIRRWLWPTAAEDRERGKLWARREIANGRLPAEVRAEIMFSCEGIHLDAFDWGAIDECYRHDAS